MARGGYKPSDFDGRDKAWTIETSNTAAVQLPRPALRDQGSEVDCCTSAALATAIESIDLNRGQETPLADLFHYYYARQDPKYLGSVTLRQALKVAATKGFCVLSLHSYARTAEGARKIPSEEAKEDAKAHRLLAYDPITGLAGYYRLDGPGRVARWKAALAEGQPIVVGLWTQDSYWQGSGILETESNAHRGAHAVAILGFDEAKQVFSARDSRGASFADEGEWPLGYAVVESAQVVESWTIRTLVPNTLQG